MANHQQRTTTLLYVQGFIAAITIPLFWRFGKMPSGLHAFIFAFLSYWALLCVSSITLLVFDPSLTRGARDYFGRPRKLWLAALGFVPVIATALYVFAPIASQLSHWALITLIPVACLNAFLEEFFWRGLTVAKFEGSLLYMGISISIFVVFHTAFLLLPLEYNGGAPNLLGGSLMMGSLWLWVLRDTRCIAAVIVAHALVNFFAFSGLFMDNGFIELLALPPSPSPN